MCIHVSTHVSVVVSDSHAILILCLCVYIVGARWGRRWVGLWVGLFLMLIAAYDLSAYIVLCTRFLHDIYAAFVCTIYISDGWCCWWWSCMYR